MIAKERLYLANDRKTVIKEGDSRARFLLAAKGQIVPAGYLVKEDLLQEDKEIKQIPNKAIMPQEQKRNRKKRNR